MQYLDKWFYITSQKHNSEIQSIFYFYLLYFYAMYILKLRGCNFYFYVFVAVKIHSNQSSIISLFLTKNKLFRDHSGLYFNAVTNILFQQYFFTAINRVIDIVQIMANLKWTISKLTNKICFSSFCYCLRVIFI